MGEQSFAPPSIQISYPLPIAVNSTGATKLVSGITDFRIVVVQYNYMANGTVNVKWQSNSTDVTGLGYCVANTGKVVGYSPVGWFQTAKGEDLNINLSANVAVGGEFSYYLIRG